MRNQIFDIARCFFTKQERATQIWILAKREKAPNIYDEMVHGLGCPSNAISDLSQSLLHS